MTIGLVNLLGPILAADESGAAYRALEFDLPETGWGWAAYIGVFAFLLALAVWVYLRDAADLSPFWKVWLTALRVAVLVALAVIAVNPQERTQKTSYRPSRVAVLVDSSLSMRYPATMPPSGTQLSENPDHRTRADAVRQLLAETDLLKTLQKDHDVSIYTFDSALSGPHEIFRTTNPQAAALQQTSAASGEASPETAASALDWDEILRPRGLETRLGESLLELIRQASGRTLSGIVLITDGAANAGVEPVTARDAALSAKARLIAVGVGSTQQPVNLQLAGIQGPTDVHVGDAFELSAFVQGQGLAGRNVNVELLMRPEGEQGAPTLVDSREVQLLEDGIPVEVKFERQPGLAGGVEFFVRTAPSGQIRELSLEDNEGRKTVNFVDRKTRVLLIAGGPMRDYRFVRNMLYRHGAIELDVWLQTTEAGTAVSQESDRLLFAFPESREEFFQYDVVVAFDPDWTQIPSEGLAMLNEWVYRDGGGMILVAGDVYTSQLAESSPQLEPIRELYPVLLASYLVDLQFNNESQQPWPIQFTREGGDAGFLQLADDPVASAELWQEFSGVYRAYPTSGTKAGAVVYAHFPDPRSETEHGYPVLLASQFYGSGRTLYLGAAEMWRLRSLDEEYYDRFWTKAIREVGQARIKRGTNRGTMLLERNQYVLGQTVRVRAQLLDPAFEVLTDESVAMEVFDPNGRPVVPAPKLLRDKNRPGQYVGDFRAGVPGTWRIELAIPESQDKLVEKIDVILPNLETDNPRQNAQLLRNITLDTGGTYLPIDEAAREIPSRLPNRGEEFIVDERLRTLWDRQWVMFGLVGLLSIEWLTRKLLKLA